MSKTANKAETWQDYLGTKAEQIPDEEVKELGLATRHLSHIPANLRSTFSLYFATRQYVALQTVAEATGTSVQDLVREGVRMILDKHSEPPKKGKKKTSKKAR